MTGEWAKSWQREHRSIISGLRRVHVAFRDGCFLLALRTLRVEPPHARQLFVGTLLSLGFGRLVVARSELSHLSLPLGACLRELVCRTLVLMGIGCALQIALVAVALSAGVQLTVPLQALVSHDPELAWPLAVPRGAHVISPMALGHALGVVPFIVVILLDRLVRQMPSWVRAIVVLLVVLTLAGGAFRGDALCVSIYRSPVITVAVGLLLIVAAALGAALLSRHTQGTWQRCGSAGGRVSPVGPLELTRFGGRLGSGDPELSA